MTADATSHADERLRAAIVFAMVLQVVLGLLCALMLDFGVLVRLFGIVLVAFWVGFVVFLGRRPPTLTRIHLLFVRYGFVVLLVLGWLVAHFALGVT